MESSIVGRGEDCREVRPMWIGIVRIFLASLLLGLVGAIGLPNQASSSQGLGGDLKIFHMNLGLTQTDLTAQQAIENRVKSFAAASFLTTPTSSEKHTPVDLFILTVSDQAVRENWKSLNVDVWVGGKTSPIGYYFRYEALDSADSHIHGGAFLAASADLAKVYLDTLLSLSSRSQH